MKQSASRFTISTAREVSSTKPGAATRPAADRAMQQALRPLLDVPVSVQPLLRLQQLACEGRSAIIICNGARSAQRHSFEFAKAHKSSGVCTIALHELMPAHQQDYLVETIDASSDFLMPCPVAVFTTHRFYPQLMSRMPWLEVHSEIITVSPEKAMAEPASPPPAVSCICLRESKGGRWVLTDDNIAVAVQPDKAPAAELVPRLLRHCVEISGNQLAPYIAMMFDVPAAWKIHPELATRALLIFKENRCYTGCQRPGIPKQIAWSYRLGLIM